VCADHGRRDSAAHRSELTWRDCLLGAYALAALDSGSDREVENSLYLRERMVGGTRIELDPKAVHKGAY